MQKVRYSDPVNKLVFPFIVIVLDISIDEMIVDWVVRCEIWVSKPGEWNEVVRYLEWKKEEKDDREKKGYGRYGNGE